MQSLPALGRFAGALEWAVSKKIRLRVGYAYEAFNDVFDTHTVQTRLILPF